MFVKSCLRRYSGDRGLQILFSRTVCWPAVLFSWGTASTVFNKVSRFNTESSNPSTAVYCYQFLLLFITIYVKISYAKKKKLRWSQLWRLTCCVLGYDIVKYWWLRYRYFAAKYCLHLQGRNPRTIQHHTVYNLRPTTTVMTASIIIIIIIIIMSFFFFVLSLNRDSAACAAWLGLQMITGSSNLQHDSHYPRVGIAQSV